MKSVPRLTLLALLLLLAACVAAQNPSEFDGAAEAQIFAALNQSRAEAGVPPLKLSPKLVEAARRHCLLLVQHHVPSHQFSGEPSLTERLRSAGLFFSTAAENVGMNTELSDVNSMFLRSPGHRTNMLNPAYDAAGIGVVHAGSAYWVTEDFAKLTPELSAEQAEDEAAAAVEAKWKHAHAGPLKRVKVEGLPSFACKAARAGGKLQSTPVTYEGRPARQVFAYSTADPSSLTPQLDSALDTIHFSAYAVAACTPQEAESNGQFWIVMAFF